MRMNDGRPGADPAGGTVESTPANARAILRVGNEFFLRSIDSIVAAQGDDLVAGLIYTATWIANVRHITLSAANIAYGGMDDLPPDALRWPVSVRALSQMLRMPYETVRRYIQAMIRAGTCVRIGKRGVVIPAAVHNQPDRRRALAESSRSLLLFIDGLKRAGFDFAPYRSVLPGTVAQPAFGAMPSNGRALLRAGADLVMRGVDTIGRLHGGDFLTGMIAITISAHNVRHITRSRDNLKYGAMDQLPPDALRKPVTVNAVAAALRLPYETTRRHISALVRDGGARRIDGKGVIIPSVQFARPDYFEAARQSYRHIVATVADLHRAGFDFRAY